MQTWNWFKNPGFWTEKSFIPQLNTHIAMVDLQRVGITVRWNHRSTSTWPCYKYIWMLKFSVWIFSFLVQIHSLWLFEVFVYIFLLITQTQMTYFSWNLLLFWYRHEFTFGYAGTKCHINRSSLSHIDSKLTDKPPPR